MLNKLLSWLCSFDLHFSETGEVWCNPSLKECMVISKCDHCHKTTDSYKIPYTERKN